MHSRRADIASDFLVVNGKIDTEIKSVREQIVGLRRAVIECNSVAVGHGILIRELEARLRRMERHLNLPSMDAR